MTMRLGLGLMARFGLLEQMLADSLALEMSPNIRHPSKLAL
jgi:hypothetical protein